MCVWNEEYTLKNAINSSKEIVDKYYIIDKNGNMNQIINDFINKGINIHYEIKPNLNLLESRKYAIDLAKEEWMLIQDGDEIILNTLLVKKLLKKRYVCYQTKMLCEEKDRKIQPYHTFLFHKTQSLHYFKDNTDIPIYKGRYIRLKEIFKLNKNLSKSKKRIWYRKNYWKEYQYSKYSGSIEEYVKEKYNIDYEHRDKI